MEEINFSSIYNIFPGIYMQDKFLLKMPFSDMNNKHIQNNVQKSATDVFIH